MCVELPFKVLCPESVAFDHKGEGSYTGASDDRILKWQGSKHEWKEFAITSPVTPRPDEVHSTCNCRGAYVHQVPL